MISKFFTRVVDSDTTPPSSTSSSNVNDDPASPRSSTYRVPKAAAKKPVASKRESSRPLIEESPAKRFRGTSAAAAKATSQKGGEIKHTPLEKQVLELKSQNPGTLLMIECGYKYQFFGEDAEIAARVLNIYAYQKCNLLTASVPVGRLHVHCGRLIHAGHKVGVVTQTDTAALKALQSGSSKTFQRHLSAVYTRATYIGAEFDSLQGSDPLGESSQFIMALWEDNPQTHLLSSTSSTLSTSSTSSTSSIAMMMARPSTGEVVYDVFEDSFVRSALETRLEHLKPCELLLPEDLSVFSKETADLLEEYARSQWCNRTERLPNDVFDAQRATSETMGCFSDDGGEGSEVVERVLKFPKHLTSCFGALLHYLKGCQLHSSLALLENWSPFISTQAMKLPGNCIYHLELLRNLTNFTRKGSLLEIIDRTSTAFGARMLEEWVRHPLLSPAAINARLDAVQQLHASPALLSSARASLSSLPDLERAICRLFYKKCSPREYICILDAFKRLISEPWVKSGFPKRDDPEESNVASQLLEGLFSTLSSDECLSTVAYFLNSVSREAAAKGELADLFLDAGRFPAIPECKAKIREIEQEFKEHLKEVKERFRNAEYVSILGTEYMIQLPISMQKQIPRGWTKMGQTKQYGRYHDEFITEQLLQLNAWRERLQKAASDAWSQFLSEFGSKYGVFRKLVRAAATLDCLSSLAEVAHTAGYVRPQINSDDEPLALTIVDGRNPVTERLTENFVPNSLSMGGEDGPRCVILTGANMGGKSTTMRQVALLCVMAQIGSFVPATSLSLSPVDAIFTRMGASDDLMGGRSTFFIELQEASQMLSKATSRSLVILDELGRGTSTYDGAAIAHATLDHLVNQVGCWVLFATHYQQISGLESEYPRLIANYHMGFVEQNQSDIVFLYRLQRGIARSSYGMNVARLAGVPSQVIERALHKSREFVVADAAKNPIISQWISIIQAISSHPLATDSLVELQRSLKD